MHDAEIDQYLAKVQQGLRFLPSARQAEELMELRQHLEFLSTGRPYPLQQFGAPEAVAHRIATAWWRGNIRRSAGTSSALAILLGALLYAPNLLNRWLIPGVFNGILYTIWLCPIVAGFLLGFRRRHQALLIIPMACFVKEIFVAIDILGLPLLQSVIHHTGVGDSHLALRTVFSATNTLPLAFECIADTALGTICAAAGSAVARRLSGKLTPRRNDNGYANS